MNQISKLVYTGIQTFSMDQKQVEAYHNYLKMIRGLNRPVIVLRRNTVALDVLEGFQARGEELAEECFDQVKKIFQSRIMTRNSTDTLSIQNSASSFLYGTYKTKEDAIFVASALAKVDYQTKPRK